MKKVKEPLTTAEKMQRSLRRRKRAGKIIVGVFDVFIAVSLALNVAVSWCPTLLSVSLGAIGISFASALRAITILDFMLGTSVLLFETTLWVLLYLKVVKLIHKGLTWSSHKLIAMSMQRRGGKKQ